MTVEPGLSYHTDWEANGDAEMLDRQDIEVCEFSKEMARPAGIEPATLGLEGRCSIL